MTANGLDLPLQYIKGAGPKVSASFAKMGIFTIRDLLLYLPYRYQDRRTLSRIADVRPDGKEYVIKAQPVAVRLERTFRRKMYILRAIVQDGSGALQCIWFNQPYLKDLLERQNEVLLCARAQYSEGRLSLISPEVETDTECPFSMLRIVPYYTIPSNIKGISLKKMRQLIANVISFAKNEGIEDHLYPYFKEGYNGCLPFIEACEGMHFPQDFAVLEKARSSLVVREFFIFFREVKKLREEKAARRKAHYLIPEGIIDAFEDMIGFKFTAAQRRVAGEIIGDMQKPFPMNRLLQGDVGSGKTAIAFLAAYIAAKNKRLTAFMVPTEILARQHYNKAVSVFREEGIYIIALLGSMKKKEREDALKRIASAEGCIVIGTHALIEDWASLPRLSLAIIDEEHRFGVSQREALLSKTEAVDTLVMTATPIPRSLCLTLYGQMSASILDELPPGRRPVKTIWITNDKRDRLYSFIRSEVAKGRQVYMIYPMIDQNDEFDLLAAEEMYDRLKNGVFSDLSVGIIHGRMTKAEQEKTMSLFYQNKINILIATVVIEVGIDVPNASVIVVEHAERFGLSQLHQLRGRIGRGEYDSYCIVVSDTDNEYAKTRLGVFVKYSDGFMLSEADLKLRGPGHFFGVKQHGPTEFLIGNPVDDYKLLCLAKGLSDSIDDRRLAAQVAEALADEPLLLKSGISRQ